jgi:aminoglycoside phosphotransferase (APT) family kinase protein
MSSTLVRIVEQPGLEWEEDLFSCEPRWTKEPSIDVIKKLTIKHLGLSDEDAVEISFFAEGAFNKLYAIDCAKGRFIFRTSLPVAPGIKTKSEVATLAFVRQKTSIPVPLVFAYDADLRNELGFEWMLMERLDARPLHEVWHQMSWLKKGVLVMQAVDFMAQLFRIEMSGIGSLYLADECTDSMPVEISKKFTVGEVVLPPFFKGSNITVVTDRGPFSTSQAYIKTRICFAQHFASKLDLEDEDDAEHYEDVQTVLSGIDKILPRLFPEAETERTVLCNRDISMSNLLVTDAGDLVSTVDWECCAMLPRALSTQLPHFLKGPAQHTVPELDADSEPSELYFETLERYEKTRLREFFLEEMARVEPRWIEVYETERKKQDVIIAIDHCENDMLVKWAKGWVEVVVAGREPRSSLGDMGRDG